jgi:hypothetical protein
MSISVNRQAQTPSTRFSRICIMMMWKLLRWSTTDAALADEILDSHSPADHLPFHRNIGRGLSPLGDRGSPNLREKHPHLKSRLPSLWSRSYYVGSIGQISEETVRRYIDEQRRS